MNSEINSNTSSSINFAGTLMREKAETFNQSSAREALQKLRQTLRESKKAGDQKKMAWALVQMALIFRGQRQYFTSLQYLEEARALFGMIKNDQGLATVFYELSFANRELDRNALALEYGHQAIELFKGLGKTLELGWTYDNMGAIHFNMFHRNESLEFGKKARTIFLEFNALNGLAWNACNLARLYFEMGFYDKSEQFYLEGQKTFEKIPNRQGVAWAHLGLASVYREWCQYERAVEHLKLAKTLYTERDLKDLLGWCLLHEAAINRILGDSEEAMLLNKRGTQVFSQIRHHDGVAWGLFQVGQIMGDRGHLIKAWQTMREALNLHTDISNRKGMGWAENEMGKTYLELNDLSHARECFIKAKVTSEQLDNSHLKLEVDKNLSKLHLDEGLLQKGLELIQHCEAASEKIHAIEVNAEVFLEKARYYLMIQEVKKARESAASAETLIETNGLVRLKPMLGIYWAEIICAEGGSKEALSVLESTYKLSVKLDQRRHRVEALLGICQLTLDSKPISQVTHHIAQIESEIRVLSSRKLKAKLFMLKGLAALKSTRAFEPKFFNQALQVADAAGLTVLERQALELLAEIHYRAGKIQEKEYYDRELKALLENGPVDLHLVRPRFTLFEKLPISLTA